MRFDSIRPLEFDKIREQLARFTSFAPSEELARALMPSSSELEIIARQKETTEARALLDSQPGLSIGGARDVRPLTRTARLGGMLSPSEFLDLRATLLAARSQKRTLLRLEPNYPRLAWLAKGLDDVPVVVDAINRVLNEQGEVLDSASPLLGAIRRDLNVARSRLMERLQHILASPQFAKYLQEPIITQRDGRYVVPVRAEARGRVNGIVHDASASGATLFVEPLAVVELGNRVRELQAQEQREIERILRELTDLVGAFADQIDQTVETLAALDLAFAKAKYSAQLGAVEPQLVAGSKEQPAYLELREARHPLLDPDKVVPISLELQKTFTVLILTGPNTGGKTVTLKTVGLMALMAQSGLHIPAKEGSRLPIYAGIYADIGDEQSIEQSLSTFSAHLTNIIGLLREADSRSLVLLDELGAGTDPVEGAALARAIVEYLLERKIPTIVATHYAELKAFAHTTPGVENASMEFDVETLAPTFRLTLGLPGRSNAFAIAERLGLAREIVERARANVNKSNVELETLLAELNRSREETARELSRAAAAREAAERAAAQARKNQQETERARREILERAREEARAEILAARAELSRLKREWRQLQVSREEIARAEHALDALMEQMPPPAQLVPSVAPIPEKQLSIGDTVYVPSLNQFGQVVSIAKDEYGIQIGSFRTTLKRDQIELQTPRGGSEPQPSESAVVLPTVESPGMELHLRGMRADEALEELSRYLDRAYLAGLPYVRIVHGKGTGTLRKLARQFLDTSPLVASYRNAEPSEGGEGVTIVHLAPR